MKLLTIINRLYLTNLLIVLLIGGMAGFFIIRTSINNEFNKKLIAEKDQLIKEIKKNPNVKEGYFLNIGDKISFEEIPLGLIISESIKDTIYYDEFEKSELPFRNLSFSEKIKGKNYLIIISKSLLPNMDLIQSISIMILGISVVLIIALIFINKVILQKLWAPFDYTLSHLKTFDITNPQRVDLDKYRLNSKVDEFKQLNNVLDKMITQSIKDYNSLKEFTENTSHEIQTPLAIIKNKAEALLQEDLSKEQLEDVVKIYDAAGRLSRLKSGLSLISRIDNNQYIQTNTINVRDFIEQKLDDMEELIAIKKLKVKKTYYGNPMLELNEELAGILFTNLLNNAIKHNFNKGKINIILKEVELLIENTGGAPIIPTEQMFNRFQKSGESLESTGLGLSLVKKIVEYYQLKVKYVFDNDMHKVYLTFNHYADPGAK